jgi:hypothetical protein
VRQVSLEGGRCQAEWMEPLRTPSHHHRCTPSPLRQLPGTWVEVDGLDGVGDLTHQLRSHRVKALKQHNLRRARREAGCQHGVGGHAGAAIAEGAAGAAARRWHEGGGGGRPS